MVYFDNAASTPVDERVLEVMMPYWREYYGNPSSIHFPGQKVKKDLEKARKIVAGFLDVNSNEIIFTSGATESNNMAIKSVIKGILFNKKSDCICCPVKLRNGASKTKPHIITLKIEHHAVSKPCEEMEKMGMAELSYVSVESDGIVDPQKIKDSIKSNTRLISIMYVNNEVGTIQPIKEISEIIKGENNKRDKDSKIYFHTDAAQGYCLDMDVNNLGVDLLSLSAHKFYGPKGAGVLYTKKGTPFLAIINGGVQEFGWRGGTQNIPAIMGMAKAIETIDCEEFKEIQIIRDLLINRIEKEILGAKLNGSRENRIYGNVNFSFDGVEGEALMLSLSDAGFAVSTGSACTVRTSAVSYVLEDLGVSLRDAHSSIRITLGKQNTKEEVEQFVEALKVSVGRLREIAGK